MIQYLSCYTIWLYFYDYIVSYDTMQYRIIYYDILWFQMKRYFIKCYNTKVFQWLFSMIWYNFESFYMIQYCNIWYISIMHNIWYCISYLSLKRLDKRIYHLNESLFPEKIYRYGLQFFDMIFGVFFWET